MTKLKAPVFIEVSTVEEAAMLWHILNASAVRSIEDYSKDRVEKNEIDLDVLIDFKHAQWLALDEQLKKQGVNPHTVLKGQLASLVPEAIKEPNYSCFGTATTQDTCLQCVDNKECCEETVKRAQTDGDYLKDAPNVFFKDKEGNITSDPTKVYCITGIKFRKADSKKEIESVKKALVANQEKVKP
jgi:hypothetical protein